MSAIRAKINCERCYLLASASLRTEGSSNVSIAQDDQIYEARNEALRALEESLRYCQETYMKIRLSSARMRETEKILLQDQIEGIESLEACGKCDYSSPKIAEVLKKRKVLELLAQQLPEKFSQES